MIAEQFYLHMFNMNRGSLHIRGFRRIHLSVFRLKIALRARKASGAFKKRAWCNVHPRLELYTFICFEILISSYSCLRVL